MMYLSSSQQSSFDLDLMHAALKDLPRELSIPEQAMYSAAMLDSKQRGSLKSLSTEYANKCREIQIDFSLNQ